jgi:hypothetical protein
VYEYSGDSINLQWFIVILTFISYVLKSLWSGIYGAWRLDVMMTVPKLGMSKYLNSQWHKNPLGDIKNIHFLQKLSFLFVCKWFFN